jgi:RecA/RadA recombinase
LYEPGDESSSDDYWLIVIWAIASLGWNCGEEIAREWSRRSARYTDDGFDKAWDEFDPTRPNAIGIGSLYRLAIDRGWKPPEPAATPGAANDARYKVLSTAEISAIPQTDWCVKHILPAKGMAAIFGPSGSGKSFLALHLAACIATGQKWFGIRTKQSAVAYVMLEGEGGIRNRIAALEKEHGSLPVGKFGVVAQPFRLTEPQDVEDLAAALLHTKVVFIDTLNRAAPTSDENSSKEMGLILEAAKWLQASIGGLVVVVHHTGKDSTKGMRGHSSLHAALDAAIEVERSANGGRTWSVAKSKDGEDGKRTAFKLIRHVLGQDSDGEEISSCSVQSDSSTIFAKPEPQGKQQKVALKAIRAAMAAPECATGMAGCPAGNKCMRVDDAISVVTGVLTGTPSNKRTNEARRIVKALILSAHLMSGLDATQDAWCWLG